MPAILRVMGANAALVLVPSALGLYWLSRDGSLDPPYFALQVLELLAGAVNISLLLVNVHAGLKLAGRLRRRPARAAHDCALSVVHRQAKHVRLCAE